MQPMPCVSLMEGRSAVAECEWSCPMVRSVAAAAARPRLGVGDLEIEKTTGAVVHRPDEDLHAGGASAAVVAGLSPETGGERGPSPGTGTTNLHAPSLDPEAVPGPTIENKGKSVSCKRSSVETVLQPVQFLPFHTMDNNTWPFGHFWVFFLFSFKQSNILVSLPFFSPSNFHIR